MTRCNALTLAALLLAAPAVVPAHPVASAPALPASGGGRPDESLQRRIIEDEGVRIEETRLRGAPQRITVQSKVGNAREYEILVGRGGRDTSQDRGAAGQRAWSVFGY